MTLLVLCMGWTLAAGVSCSTRSEDTPPAVPRESPTATIGSFGVIQGQFSSPRAVACGPGGTVAAIDKTGRVQVFDQAGELAAHWAMPKTDKGTPTGLCFDDEGTLLIADTHYHRVLRYSAAGEVLASFGSYGEGPGQFIYPTDVAIAADGSLLVAEYGKNDRILRFDRNYAFVSHFGGHGVGEGQFRRPMGLAIDREGCIYVADAINHRIQKFSSDGQFILAWGEAGKLPGQFMYPYDLDLDREGRVVVCEYGNCRIQRFTTDGGPLGTFGGPGRSNTSLSSPWSLDAAPDGRLFVADMLNHRLLVLSPACPFVSPIQ